MMKFFLSVNASLLAILASPAKGLKVFEGFLSTQEIDFYRNIPVSPNSKGSCQGSDRYFGHVNLTRAMIDRLVDTHGEECTLEGGTDASMEDLLDQGVEIRTSFIHRTTTAHIDRINGVGHKSVTFVFLNDNPDAVFVHGNQEVQAKAGRLVTFEGHLYHQTKVTGGNVHLLGPFDSNDFEPIGCGIVLDCCGEVTNREDTCLAACNANVTGVTCIDDGNTTCGSGGAPGTPPDSPLFHCCDKDPVDTISLCRTNCYPNADANGIPKCVNRDVPSSAPSSAPSTAPSQEKDAGECDGGFIFHRRCK